MTLTFLWTDIMVWILLFSLIAWGRVISRSIQAKKQWSSIFKSHIAMISSIILLVYLLFALLDSVHFYKTKSAEMVSLLDIAFEHRIKETERTYSAPFAKVEYAKSIIIENGVSKQINLPLKYVKDETIISSSFTAFIIAGLISFFLILAHILWRKSKGWKEVIPWRSAYITLVTVIIIFTWLYVLSFDYHVLGTDKVGGDVLYQSLKSIRTGVLIGILTTLIMLPVSIILGVSAGLFGGWIDDAIQYLYTTLSSIPSVLLIAAGVLVMQVMMDGNPEWFETTEERSDLRMLFLK